MEGHGAYNRNSQVQASGIAPAIGSLEDAARAVPIGSGAAPLVVADYGCSAGRNSLLPIGIAVRALRERAGTSRDISIVHNDLPNNDYAALFDLLANDPASYLGHDPRVFASAVGHSFFEQVVPSGSVTLGWSSWSVQWLSSVPMEIPDNVAIGCSEDAAARAAFARRAADDWATFLRARALELRTGGRLVVVTMASDDSGDFGYRVVVAAINKTLRELAETGFLSETEVRRMVIPTYGRTRAEFVAPFGDSARFGDLALVHAELFFQEDHIWADTGEGRDAETFGARWAAFSRASVGPTLALFLEGGTGDPRRTEFLDRYEATMARLLAAKPEKSLMPLVQIVLEKRGAG
jgi:hypothetical protein